MSYAISSVLFHKNGNPACDTVSVFVDNGRSYMFPTTLTGYPFHFRTGAFQSARIFQGVLIAEYSDGISLTQKTVLIGSDSL